MLRAAGPSGNIEEAITAVLGTDEETLTTDWHTETRKTYAALFETTRKPETFSRALMNEQTSGGKLNLAPSISPDGKRMVFSPSDPGSRSTCSWPTSRPARSFGS